MTISDRLRALDDRALDRVPLLRRLVAAAGGAAAAQPPGEIQPAGQAHPQPEPWYGPVSSATAEPSRDDTDRRARAALALVGAVASVVLLAVYYVPGMRDNADAGSIALVLAVPAAALVLPFALLALLLRVRLVWLVCGLLMLFFLGSAARDLLLSSEPQDGSLLLFFLLFVLELVTVGVAAVIDFSLRGARRAVGSRG